MIKRLVNGTNMSSNEFFEKYNLVVQPGDVEVGKTYPLYGIVTKILNDSFDDFTIEINHTITLKCTLKTQESVDTIKERAFEPGIFIAQITSSDPVAGHCETIVFGKKPRPNMA